MTLISEKEDNLQQLVLQRRWEDVEKRVKIHPQELKIRNDDGLNVLHLACSLNPPSAAFRAMLEQDRLNRQGAALMTEWYGRNPLMYVCDGRGPISLVKDFIEMAPHCISTVEEGGWTPLHYLCVNTRERTKITLEMAERVLHVDKKQMTMKDSHGQTPLKLLCDQFEALASDFSDQVATSQMQMHSHMMQLNNARVFEDLEYFWNLACILVRSNCNNPENTPLLHQFCSFPKCPEFLLGVALQKFPSDLTKKDQNGNTPLHLAVLLEDADLFVRLLSRERKALKIQNNQGELPITLSFSKRWSVLNSILLNENPGGLVFSDFPEALYPQLLGRVQVGPNTVYSLLKAMPSLLQSNNP